MPNLTQWANDRLSGTSCAALSALVGLTFIACASGSEQATRPTPPPRLIPQQSGTEVRLQAVSAVNDSVVWASGVAATVSRTIDGGDHWRSIVVPGPAELQFRDVHGVSADTAFILSSGSGNASRIYRTTDGGDSWTLQFLNDEPDAFFDCFDFWDASTGVAFSDAVSGKLIVVRTTDGERWRPVPQGGVPAARGSEGGFAASGTCVVTKGERFGWIGTGAGDTARVLRTRDGGTSWRAAELPIVGGTSTSGVFSLVFFDENRGMALGGDLADTVGFTDNVAVTFDGGETWSLAGKPTFAGPVYGAAQVPGLATPTVVAVGPNGMSFTTDGGQTWAPADTASYWAVTFASPNAGWAVGPDGRIVKLTWDEDSPTEPSG